MKRLHRRLLRVSVALTACSGIHMAGALAETPTPREIVSKSVQQLGSADFNERVLGGVHLESMPYSNVSLIEVAEKQPDLDPQVKDRLDHLLNRIHARINFWKWEHARRVEFDTYALKADLSAYDQGGHADPKWDDAARQSFALKAKGGMSETASERKQLHEETKKLLGSAIAAGCDDPAVLVTAGLESADTAEPVEKVAAWFDRALKSADARTDPYIKVIIDGRELRQKSTGIAALLTEEDRQECKRLADDMEHQYQLAAKAPGVPAQMMESMADNVFESCKTVIVKPRDLFDAVYPSLETAYPNDPNVLAFKGKFYINYAWEARGAGAAGRVTQQGWKDFADRLDVANAALTKAWELDPAFPAPPTLMLKVELGQGKGANVMETWFQRAMAANPDNLQACQTKLLYLQPKWHGNPEAMIKFGRECYEDGDWRENLPFLLVDAHVDLAKLAADQSTYYQQETVWPDIHDVYTTYLQLRPENDKARTILAHYACLCGQWKTANDLFKQLGDKADASVFGDKFRLKESQRQAAEHAE